MATKTTTTLKTVAPAPAIQQPDGSASTLPQVIIGRPHNMPRRLMNVGASRRDTSGKE